MKTNLPLQFLFASILIIGCKGENAESGFPQYNTQQIEFFSRIDLECNAYRGITNKIEKKESIDNYLKKGVLGYIDSTGLFIEWVGVLESYEISSVNYPFNLGLNLDGLKIYINLKPLDSSKVRKIAFESIITINRDRKDTLLVYNQLKELNNGDTIILDGFIEKNNKEGIKFGISGIGENTPCNSVFSFYPVSIQKAGSDYQYSESFINLRQSLVKAKIDYDLSINNISTFKQTLKNVYSKAQSLDYFEKKYLLSLIQGIE